MTLEELLARLSGIIQDSSYDDLTLLGFLNRGRMYVASRGLLPVLAASTTLTTSTSNPYVDLPVDYHRQPSFVSSLKNAGAVPIEKSWQRFIRRYPRLDETGSINLVAVHGLRLYYQPKPVAADTLTIWYHSKPDVFSLDAMGEVATELESPFDESLLINFAAREIYAEIEDGIAGAPVNTKKYAARFETALAELREFLGPEDADPVYVRDDSEDW